MPPNELNMRKKELVQQLNGFIGMKKAYGAQAQQRGELLDGAKPLTPNVESEWSWRVEGQGSAGALECLLCCSLPAPITAKQIALCMARSLRSGASGRPLAVVAVGCRRQL